MKPIFLILLVTAASGLFSGCETSDVRYTNPADDSTAVRTLHKVTIREWDLASDQMIDSLLASPALTKTPHTPATLAIDRIANKTQDANLNTDVLTKNITVALNRSNKVLTTTTYGRHAESRGAQDAQAKRDFLGDSDHPVDRTPDFFLSGKIIQDSTQSGNTTQVTYIFQLSLTDAQSGAAVWEDQRMIQKTGNRQELGW